MKGAPDYTRVTEIRGQDPTGELVTLAVDANGQLYAVIKGTDGTTLRTIAVDASGRIIMVPYGVTSISGTATVTQAEKDREVQGKDGVTLRTLAVDANGQLIMVPRGQSGNYMSVDASGFLTAVLKGTDAGAVLRSILVDASGQLIMVPRGQSGNYMSVDASGYMTSVMKGVDGVTLRTVAVDSSGNIIGVLQGDYAGSLKTLAVDSEGRMLAVLTDPEDVFGNPHYMGAAELAARLGSISSYDRQGQILFQDSFEELTWKWVHLTSGTYSAVDFSIEMARTGAVGVRLVAGDEAGAYAGIAHSVAFPTVTPFGLEISYAFSSVPLYVEFRLELFDGTNLKSARVRYNNTDGKYEYYDSAGAWQDITGSDVVVAAAVIYQTLKLVVNFATSKYVRVKIGEKVLDLSAYSINSSADSDMPRLRAQIYLYNNTSDIDYLYVDDAIMTQNEV